MNRRVDHVGHAVMVALAAIAVTGCRTNTPAPPTAGVRPSEARTGICRLEIKDPVIRIASAADSTTGLAIAQLALTHFVVDGRPVSGVAGFIRAPVTSGVRVTGDTLVCDVPCGFSTETGNYSLSVSATGYEARQLSIPAYWRHTAGTCPATASGSVNVAVFLRSRSG